MSKLIVTFISKLFFSVNLDNQYRMSAIEPDYVRYIYRLQLHPGKKVYHRYHTFSSPAYLDCIVELLYHTAT